MMYFVILYAIPGYKWIASKTYYWSISATVQHVIVYIVHDGDVL